MSVIYSVPSDGNFPGVLIKDSTVANMRGAFQALAQLAMDIQFEMFVVWNLSVDHGGITSIPPIAGALDRIQRKCFGQELFADQYGFGLGGLNANHLDYELANKLFLVDNTRDGDQAQTHWGQAVRALEAAALSQAKTVRQRSIVKGHRIGFPPVTR